VTDSTNVNRQPHSSGRLPALIFDVDGVLVASPHERAWQDALAHLMAHDWRGVAAASSYAPQRFDTTVYQRYVSGKPRQSGARAVLDYFQIPDAASRAVEYARTKQALIEDLIARGEFEAFADALRFVGEARRQGFRMAAASSSKNANDMMARIWLDPPAGNGQQAGKIHLLDVFEVNVCGRDVKQGKPAPDLFLLAAEELQVPAAHCIVVEDATAGVQAAKAGGMRAIGLARLDDAALLQEAGADLVVTVLDDVAVEPLVMGALRREQAAG